MMVSELAKGITESCDVSKWDHSLRQVVGVIAFSIHAQIMGLKGYLLKVYNCVRNYTLTMPLYHPSLKYKYRTSGVMSGSGHTTSLNTTCLWIIEHCALFDLCSKQGESIYDKRYFLYVSGDDSVICTRD